jgi:hypothetical protein
MGGITQERFKYLKVSGGRMINKKDGVIIDNFSGYKGLMLGIRQKDGEYQGEKTVNIEVKMRDADSDDVVIIQFTKMALFSKGFFQTIKKVDLAKPFTILTWGSDDNDKISFCGLQQPGYAYIKKQDGSMRKTIEPDPSFPNYKEIPLNGKMTKDWTEPLAAMDVILKELSDKFGTAPAQQSSSPSPSAAPPSALPPPEDDLPF